MRRGKPGGREGNLILLIVNHKVSLHWRAIRPVLLVRLRAGETRSLRADLRKGSWRYLPLSAITALLSSQFTSLRHGRRSSSATKSSALIPPGSSGFRDTPLQYPTLRKQTNVIFPISFRITDQMVRFDSGPGPNPVRRGFFPVPGAGVRGNGQHSMIYCILI